MVVSRHAALWNHLHHCDLGGRLIAVRRGSESITLEPGGQVELSGGPRHDLHLMHAELSRHVAEVSSHALITGSSRPGGARQDTYGPYVQTDCDTTVLHE